MAETLTNTNGALTLKAATAFVRPFYFGTLSQTVTVNLSKNGGTWAAAAGTVAEIGGAGSGKGWYTVSLSNVDTNNAGAVGNNGVLSYNCTAASGGPVDFCDLVTTTVFPDLSLDGTGRVFTTSNNKQNAAQNVFFAMTVSGAPTPGLSITGFRNFGSGFSAVSGAITDLGNGAYMFAAQPVDTNAPTGLFRFIAPGADDRDIFLYFVP
jgi:hypothetical protein